MLRIGRLSRMATCGHARRDPFFQLFTSNRRCSFIVVAAFLFYAEAAPPCLKGVHPNLTVGFSPRAYGYFAPVSRHSLLIYSQDGF